MSWKKKNPWKISLDMNLTNSLYSMLWRSILLVLIAVQTQKYAISRAYVTINYFLFSAAPCSKAAGNEARVLEPKVATTVDKDSLDGDGSSANEALESLSPTGGTSEVKSIELDCVASNEAASSDKENAAPRKKEPLCFKPLYQGPKQTKISFGASTSASTKSESKADISVDSTAQSTGKSSLAVEMSDLQVKYAGLYPKQTPKENEQSNHSEEEPDRESDQEPLSGEENEKEIEGKAEESENQMEEAEAEEEQEIARPVNEEEDEELALLRSVYASL